jgi:translation initiation factor 2 alpha subunit (eIF-2alpha)
MNSEIFEELEALFAKHGEGAVFSALAKAVDTCLEHAEDTGEPTMWLAAYAETAEKLREVRQVLVRGPVEIGSACSVLLSEAGHITSFSKA